MKFVTISDVHIKEESDSTYQLIIDFFDHAKKENIDKVFLIGDIFDLMSGKHLQYFSCFPRFFKSIEDLLKQGTDVYYIEGNHDVHLEELFEFWKNKIGKTKGNLIVGKDPIILNSEGCNFYISHGDEWEPENESYKRYKKMITSDFCKFLSNNLMPYSVLEYLGRKASSHSRKTNYVWELKESEIKEKFRSGAVQLSDHLKVNIIIGGHSHVEDYYEFEKNGQKIVYMNNGYFPKTKKIIEFDTNKLKFLHHNGVGFIS